MAVAEKEGSSRVGSMLRDWRQRRRLSQLDLALEADVSPRHVSFIETGRAAPSREMVLRLSEQLEVPLREQNRMLLAAGFAPGYGEQRLDDPEMEPVRTAIDQVLAGHMPYPAIVVDGAWEMLAANEAAGLLIGLVSSSDLLEPPVNVLRATLHPEGLSPHVTNLGEWRAHLLDRLRRQIVLSGNPALVTLLEELEAYPGADRYSGVSTGEVVTSTPSEIAVPLRLRVGDADLAFISTIATFGTAVEVTTSELSIESFFPADAATAEALQGTRPTRV